ncbi:putative bifunctional diguanylate cyclase/phosphodiesterase [Luteimonas sp. e5]
MATAAAQSFVIDPLPTDWLAWPWLLLYGLAAGLLLAFVLGATLRRQRHARRHATALRTHEDRLDLALWDSSELLWDYNIATGQLTINHRPDEHSTARITHPAWVHPDDKDMINTRLRHFLEGGGVGFITARHRVRYADRDWHWVNIRGRAVERDSHGQVLRLSGSARDVTASMAVEQAQLIATEVFQTMAEAVVVLDEGFRIVSANDALLSMTSHELDALLGQGMDFLSGLPQARQVLADMHRDLIAHGHWQGEVWHRGRDRQPLLCRAKATRVTHEANTSTGAGTHYVVVLADITEQRHAEQELRRLADYDVLTRLPNRLLFQRRLDTIVESHRDGRQFAVMFLDLDHFKDINDSLGHAAGDRALQVAADRLREIAGPSRLLARLGGDEFTMVLEGIRHEDEAFTVARTVLEQFSSPMQLDHNLGFLITPSIGISLYPEDGEDGETLLRRADTAMYQAKAGGRRMYLRYQPEMDAATLRRLQLGSQLRGAIERGEVHLVFQPRAWLKSGRIAGMEALLRWHHPELGEVAPSLFIPLAEETGLIDELGAWAAHTACRTLADWDRDGLPRISMAINVSSVQLQRDDLPHQLAEAARAHGIAPGRLEAEVTESVLLDQPPQVIERLRQMRGMGMRLSVDDFGTGFSSLAYLRDLPFNTLKIDRAFVTNLTEDRRNEALVVAIIAMARALGMRVVAEGVETAEQMHRLRELGCDQAQGFHISQPLPPDDCRGLLAQEADSLLLDRLSPP